MPNLTITKDAEDNGLAAIVELDGRSVGTITDEQGGIPSRGRYAVHCWASKPTREIHRSGLVGFYGTEADALAAIRELLGLAAAPEWRTLKGVATPFQVLVSNPERLLIASDRRTPTGTPVTVTQVSQAGGCRTGVTADGRRINFWGNATRMWVITEAA